MTPNPPRNCQEVPPWGQASPPRATNQICTGAAPPTQPNHILAEPLGVCYAGGVLTTKKEETRP